MARFSAGYARWIVLGLVSPMAAAVLGFITLSMAMPKTLNIIAQEDPKKPLPALDFAAVNRNGRLEVAELGTAIKNTNGQFIVAIDVANSTCRPGTWRRIESSLAQLSGGVRLPHDFYRDSRVRARLLNSKTMEPLTEWSKISSVRNVN
jgi:hypothetical protein